MKNIFLKREKWNFLKKGIPIFPGSSITKDELLSLVLAFKLRNNLNRKYNR
jgi:hypothetical protein